MTKKNKLRITLFHCINTNLNEDTLSADIEKDCELKCIKLACSSMVKDVFPLRAFEAGADATVVLVCPEGACRHTEGNIRAKKRVEWVKNLLDEIGINGKRLSLHNIASGDNAAAAKTVLDTLSNLTELGPNPAGPHPNKEIA
jgi:F420-non-reducing hydrogenase iron-sulfur subunit